MRNAHSSAGWRVVAVVPRPALELTRTAVAASWLDGVNEDFNDRSSLEAGEVLPALLAHV